MEDGDFNTCESDEDLCHSPSWYPFRASIAAARSAYSVIEVSLFIYIKRPVEPHIPTSQGPGIILRNFPLQSLQPLPSKFKTQSPAIRNIFNVV
jgi:hypothetical protein